jgi:hypothetical protein
MRVLMQVAVIVTDRGFVTWRSSFLGTQAFYSHPSPRVPGQYLRLGINWDPCRISPDRTELKKDKNSRGKMALHSLRK